MSALEATVLALYFAVLTTLAVYGLHRYYLVFLYYRNPRPARPQIAAAPLPRVTVQLPIYNERFVVGRLLDAVCALDYPRELLEVYVLDDSTDDTSEIVATAVAGHRRNGIAIHHLKRTNREGFKAGALAAGLDGASGELIAIFDADFVPQRDFLKLTVPSFSDPEIGMIEVRWGHLNRDYSMLTRIQSILLDGHFVIEHSARCRTGRFFNFNGTAGVWRRACIDDAGGWQHDTLTEDLDLSYRAQLRGWRFLFIDDHVAPAELPVSMASFRSQQHRWAKGSVQTCRKLLPRILRSGVPSSVKWEAFFHLTSNFTYPLMVLLALLCLPALAVRRAHGLEASLWIDLPIFLCATLSVSTFYIAAQHELRRRLLTTIALLPVLMAMGIGLSVNNARAVTEALLGRRSPFVRTPKLHVVGRDRESSVQDVAYRSSIRPWQTGVELALTLYMCVSIGYAWETQMYASLPILALFFTGFLHSSGSVLGELRHRLRTSRRVGANVNA